MCDACAPELDGLRQYWARRSMGADRAAPKLDTTVEEMRAERTLLAALRLGVRETTDFLLHQRPSFTEFEAWVRARNGGAIDAARMTRWRDALHADGTFELETVLQEPVLSAADLDFWDEHGYVVVPRAVSEDACRAAVEAIFDFTGMSMDAPDSWYQGDIWITLAQHAALWANRDAPRIHTAFAQLWDRRDLWTEVDVCGVCPPLRPGYSFRGAPLHWDVSLTRPIPFGTQAILYLTDTPAERGAFSCVAGFHRIIERWLDEHGGTAPRAAALRELKATPIAGAAGDLIIWHHALPHGATPNRAALPRVVQYLNMFPARYGVHAEWV